MKFDEWFPATFPDADKQQREIARRVWNAAQIAEMRERGLGGFPPPSKVATVTRPTPAVELDIVNAPADTWSRAELEALTKIQLLGMAEAYNISVSKAWLKADIVDAILERMG